MTRTQPASPTTEANQGGHTPGPWAIAYPAIYAPALGERVGRVGSVSIAYKDTKTYEANALLIAAAPELLEALEDARPSVAVVAASGSKVASETLAKIDAAIAKARGDA